MICLASAVSVLFLKTAVDKLLSDPYTILKSHETLQIQ